MSDNQQKVDLYFQLLAQAGLVFVGDYRQILHNPNETFVKYFPSSNTFETFVEDFQFAKSHINFSNWEIIDQNKFNLAPSLDGSIGEYYYSTFSYCIEYSQKAPLPHTQLDYHIPSQVTLPDIQFEKVQIPKKLVPKQKPNYAIVRTFYVTDRNLTGNKKPGNMFGVKRSPTLTYGVCEVSMPHDRQMGTLPSPSIWKFEFRQDPEKHVILLSTVISSKDQFFADIADRVRTSAQNSAFLFIHGYNVTFEDAARRTAQISYDIGFQGAPVFYSWPSQGKTLEYTFDEQNIEWAQANIKSFLDDFFTRSEAQNIYLIAHSMGNRALTRSVAELLAEKPNLRERLKEVILTAPDIDAAVFKQQIAPALTSTGRPVTLYASSKDMALGLSQMEHGGYPRAGDSGDEIVVVPGIETIDASNVDASLVGHSYWADNRSVISDIFYLIRDSKRANQRFGLRAKDIPAGRYWEFVL